MSCFGAKPTHGNLVASQGSGRRTNYRTSALSSYRPDYLHDQLLTMAPHRALLRSIESRFMAAVPLVHPVLDVGCGDGHFASVTFTEPIDVGMDPWERDLAECGRGVHQPT